PGSVGSLELPRACRLDESLALLHRRPTGLDHDGPRLLLRVRDLAADLLDLAELLQLLREFRPGDAPRLHAVIVRVREDAHVHEVRLDRADVLAGSHVAFHRVLPTTLQLRIPGLDVHLHTWG